MAITSVRSVQKSPSSKTIYCLARLEERLHCFARGAYWPLRERSRREERLACEPEGPANGENAAVPGPS